MARGHLHSAAGGGYKWLSPGEGFSGFKRGVSAMIRILLPLAVIASISLCPLFSETTIGAVSGDAVTTSRTGNFLVEDTIKCFSKQNFSLSGDCAPRLGMTGTAVAAALGAAAIAAVVGVPGLLPFVGRVTSFVTTAAGGIIVLGVGYFILQVMGAGESAKVEWGAYLGGGLGLLTLVAGLSGIRGK